MQFEELISLDAELLRQLEYVPALFPQPFSLPSYSASAYIRPSPTHSEFPRPVYGLIFLFRYPTQPQNASPATKAKSTERDGTLDHPAAENLFFASQTIQNACGTQALLSVLLNHDKGAEGNEGIEIGKPLREFKGFVEGFPAEVRGIICLFWWKRSED